MPIIRSILCGITAAVPLIVAAGVSPGETPPNDPELTLVSRIPDRADPASGWARRYRIHSDLADLVLRESARRGVPPAIAFGLIEVESGFDPAAVGSSGERGLMQILPSTARAYDPTVTPERLHRPEVNLRIGLAHLKREVDHFGDWSLGLLSYNMGRGRLARLLETGRRPPGGYAARILDRCGPACA